MIATDNGFQEAVAIVSDAVDSAKRLQAIFGYELIHQGAPSRQVLDMLGIDPGWEAIETLVGDPAQGRGFMRLISFPGQQTGVMRDGAQSWDTGGIFDVNIRCLRSIEEQQAAMTRNGFVGFAPVTQWIFGAFNVKEVVMRDADGLCIAMMQRLAPPLTGFEQVEGPVSFVFNSTQIVPDFDRARSLFVDTLGWIPIQETRSSHSDGINCIGLPLDIARDRSMRIGIYQPLGRFEGSVEIIQHDVEGMDFSEAKPPSRGIISLRLPVSDISASLEKFRDGGCTIIAPHSTELAPYGAVEMGAAITSWGARFELFQLS